MTPALLVYRGLTWLAVLLGAPYLLYRQWRFPEEMRERWGGGAEGDPVHPDLPADGPVWIHAASLGEIEAARAWMEDRPLGEGRSWFVTVTSTSARRRAPERLGGRVAVRFAPLDHEVAVARFLRRHRPRALILIETELWPVTLDHCRRSGVPVYVASGRITAPAWRKMRLAARLYQEVAPAVRAAAVQGTEDEERFRALRFRRIRVCGNVKYRVPEGAAPSGRPAGSRLLWVIGSLRRGEEGVLGAARRVAENGGAVVLAPRHLRERDAWVGACRRAGIDPVLRSETADPVPGRAEALPDVLFASGGEAGPGQLLVDVHGELRTWYARADAATVGGTWVPIGGHNLFEPLCEGVPVSFGPYVANVRDVAEAALDGGAGFQCEDPADLVGWVLSQADGETRQKTERSALRVARNLSGAGERTRAFLSEAEASEERGGVFRPSTREPRVENGSECP